MPEHTQYETKSANILLTVDEVCARLCIGKTYAYSLLKNGKLKSVKLGHLRRIPLSALESYIDSLITESSHS